MKIGAQEFLKTHGASWTAQRAPEYSVVNIHVAEIPALPVRIFPELARPGLLTPGGGWRLLMGIRMAAGKLFGWDRGLETHEREPLEVGKHYAFFRIEHVDAPREVGMSARNRLTEALMSWVLDEDASGGTRVYNVTCANFFGWRGQAYWRMIERFHDGIVEASLVELKRTLGEPARDRPEA